MSTCPNCQNSIAPGAEQCHFCGRIFHHTHNIVLKSAEKQGVKKVTVTQRVCAGLIDIAYMSAPILLGLFFLKQPIAETDPLQFMLQNWLLLTVFSVLQLFLLVHDGQSVGKKVMKLAIVVHETNDHPSAFRLIVLRGLVPALPFVLPYLGLALFGLNLAWGLGDEQRCLHDFIAGTQVVHE